MYFLTELAQSIFPVSNYDPVGILIFASEVIEGLHVHFAIFLQDFEWLHTMAPGVGPRPKKKQNKNSRKKVLTAKTW